MGGRIKEFFSSHATIYCIISMLFCAVFIADIVGYLALKKNYIQTIFSRCTVTLKAINENITFYMQSRMHTVQDLTQDPEIIKFLQNSSNQPIFSDNFKKKLSEISLRVIIFSLQHQPLFASDGNVSLYKKNSILQESIQRSLILFGPDVSDFVFISAQEPALYITAPIVWKNQFLGTLAVALDMASIKKITSDYTGLGNTGEIIIAKKINQVITTIFPTRFHPDIAFKQYPDEATNHDALHYALMGRSGTFITKNILHRSLFSWQYLPLVQWGVAIKADYSEVTKPLRGIKIFIVLLALFCVLGFCYFSYKSWSCLRQGKEIDVIISKMLLGLLYALFIINISLFIFLISKQYYDYQRSVHKDMLGFKGNLQKASQAVNYRATLLESVASSFAFDILGKAILEDSQQAALIEILKDNPDMDGIIFLFQKNNAWQTISYVSEKDHTVKEAHIDEKQKQFWVSKMLEGHATWSFEKNQLQNEREPFFALPFYGQQDIERKNPIGFIGIMYSTHAMIENARQKIGQLPLLLTLSDGSIIYKDKTISLPSSSINPSIAQRGSLYFEKMTGFGWYLGSVFKPESQKGKILIFIMELIILLSSMVIFVYSFLRCYTIVSNEETKSNWVRDNTFLLYACSYNALCITIVYWFAL